MGQQPVAFSESQSRNLGLAEVLNANASSQAGGWLNYEF